MAPGPGVRRGRGIRRVRQLPEVGAQAGRRLGEHVLARHKCSQVTAHPNPPGRQASGRDRARRSHGEGVRVAQHDGRSASHGTSGVQGEAGPAVGHAEHEVHVALGLDDVLGGAGHHLDHAERAVGRGQRVRAGAGDGVGQVERVQRGIEGLHPFGGEVTGHGPSLAGGGEDSRWRRAERARSARHHSGDRPRLTVVDRLVESWFGRAHQQVAVSSAPTVNK